MIIYKDAVGVYVATQAEAKRLGKGWEQVEVPTTDGRVALCDWLNKQTFENNYGPEPDPLVIDGPYVPSAQDEQDEALETYIPTRSGLKTEAEIKSGGIERSVAIDEEWDKLTLSRKLHFAAMAMEDARSQLK